MSTFFFVSADTAAVQCLDEQGHGRRRRAQHAQHHGPLDDFAADVRVHRLEAQAPIVTRRRSSERPTGDLNPFLLPDWITQAAIYQDAPREPAVRHQTAQDANAAWSPEYLVVDIIHAAGDSAPIRRERLPAGDYHQPEILANTLPGDPPVDGLPMDTGEAPQARRRTLSDGETASVLTQEPVFALIHTVGVVWPDQSTARPRVAGETSRTAAPAVYLPTDFAPTLDDWPIPRERPATREGSTEQTGRPAIFESFELHHTSGPDSLPRRQTPTRGESVQAPREIESTYLIHGTAPASFPRPHAANRSRDTATASFDLFYQEAVIACFTADVSAARHFDRTQHAQPFDWSGNAVPLPTIDDAPPIRRPRAQPGSIDRDTAEMGHEAITLSWVQDSPLPTPRNATAQPGEAPRGFWNGIISISTPWSLAAGQFFQSGAIVGDLDE